MQKFYNRELQLKELRNISDNTEKTKGRLSVVVGRRRVGKTRLLNEVFKEVTNQHIYLFISRKSESALVAEFSAIIQSTFNTKFFHPESLKDVFEFLLDYSTMTPITLVIDEFQDIERVNNSLFSDLQNLWDNYKNKSMMHLVCCGSLYNLMTKLFKDEKQPLLNRDDHFFKINPLTPSYIKEIMEDNGKYNPNDFLVWWCLSGGIPKYLEWLNNSGSAPLEKLISNGSPLIKEGMHRLVEDFGSEHRAYFDVLGAIANGYNSRPRIESYLNTGVGVNLEKLEKDFDIINKLRPITAKDNSRDIRYEIADEFLSFWFRFIYSNRSAVEIENYDFIKRIIDRDFDTYSGSQLEELFKAILAESKLFNNIGSYWDSKGEDEIDIVAIDDFNKKILIAEVKRRYKRYSEAKLIMKSKSLLQSLNKKGYEVSFRGFALDNLDEILLEFSYTKERQ
ncbi:ATPase [Pseudoalteromonas sp. A601]|uniref:ATP-binding protein n=1 Tax=Pseudoalteromonas sp. A601 TaxID=1967839 RepID=UPI000B3D3700|nr:ATP-binding protein [Pseudoalteromonas sp. A601]OUS71031.1 ATPase [Pseudoalteromonas sp. A601]